MNNRDLRNAFFDDLYAHISLWKNDVAEAFSRPEGAQWAESQPSIQALAEHLDSEEDIDQMKEVLEEVLRGLVHSILVIIDGGTKSAEVGSLSLIDSESCEPISEYSLHEEFFDYLAANDLL